MTDIDIEEIRKRVDERIELFVSGIAHLVLFIFGMIGMVVLEAPQNSIVAVALVWGAILAAHITMGTLRLLMANFRERAILREWEYLQWHSQYAQLPEKTKHNRLVVVSDDGELMPSENAHSVTSERT